MVRRVSFWCAVSAVLTVAITAIPLYCLTVENRFGVTTPFNLIASIWVGRQTLGMFVVTKRSTNREIESVADDITKGGAWALIFLLAGAGVLVIAFGSDAIGAVVGSVVLMVLEVAVA